MTPPERRIASLERRARWLVAATLAWNLIEGVLAVWWATDAVSPALLAFGLDSAIESAAAAILLWRLWPRSGAEDLARNERRERRAHALVGITFLLLAAWVVTDAGLTFAWAEPPAESLPGAILAAISLAVMPFLALYKIRTADRLGSPALRAEAHETLACAWLSAALLLGLGTRLTTGWWWADPAAALVMVPWLVREGLEGLRGEGCCDD